MIAEKEHRIGRSSHVRYDFLFRGGGGVFLQVDIYFLFSDVGNTLTTIVDIMPLKQYVLPVTSHHIHL